jgi:hypothetical protein
MEAGCSPMWCGHQEAGEGNAARRLGRSRAAFPRIWRQGRRYVPGCGTVEGLLARRFPPVAVGQDTPQVPVSAPGTESQ